LNGSKTVKIGLGDAKGGAIGGAFFDLQKRNATRGGALGGAFFVKFRAFQPPKKPLYADFET